ncbi:aminoglycoside 6-adenylyltransferase [Halobacillus kuroshimensis]|uniref:aminoglycoside 6-adenylyltransferase n=1 Tax=Halobacillus kuroshimensis TaxID=302481 RepID=UPI00041DDEB5|nr:aminoglycoside 6-adenylyltransferase [Halobacillus kuroshimensis]
MRKEQEMYDLLLHTADQDDRIRAVLLNGSRVNRNAETEHDALQDYDIQYIVSDFSSFMKDHTWIDVFGERLITQMPDHYPLYAEDGRRGRFAYLMQFTDGTRIDLTLVDVHDLPETFESLTEVLLDKDGCLPEIPDPDNRDYIVEKPAHEDVYRCSNEFWWVSLYVAKGLERKQLPYAKTMMEGPVRRMLHQMMSWYIGSKHDFSVSVGSAGKYFERFLPEELWILYQATYTGSDYNENWEALITIAELFQLLESEVSLSISAESFNSNDVYAYLKDWKSRCGM